jgi:hypothetical protein
MTDLFQVELFRFDEDAAILMLGTPPDAEVRPWLTDNSRRGPTS